MNTVHFKCEHISDIELRFTSEGTEYWYKNGKKHRDNGPAATFENGTKHWFMNGKRHREDGPAIVLSDGSKHWYKNDVLHREDGPAVEWADGSVEWWYEGRKGLEHFPFELKKKFTGKFIRGT